MLLDKIQRVVDLVCEKGVFNWFMVIFFKDMDFDFNKWEFCDVLRFRYDWLIFDNLLVCVCGSMFIVDYVMICQCGGLVIQCYNEICDLQVELFDMVCYDV